MRARRTSRHDVFRAACDRNEPFSAVITDLGMPHVDGRQVAAAIKAIEAKAKVIMLTGWGQRMADGGQAPAHVDRILSKPPNMWELREALVHTAKTWGLDAPQATWPGSAARSPDA